MSSIKFIGNANGLKNYLHNLAIIFGDVTIMEALKKGAQKDAIQR